MEVAFFRLITSSLLPIIFSAILFLADKKHLGEKLRYWHKQLVIGLLFGALAVLSTEFGIDISGATVNVRDAAPLAAGLIFGGPAGIIAGVIGGVERFFATLWGAGEYTQLACSAATVLAGIFGAGMRKFVFHNNRPSWFYGLLVGITTEVLHMLLIFLTNMSDIKEAFTYVQKCSLIMILFNSISVMLSILVVSLLNKEKLHRQKENKKISQTFQSWLLICVITAFAVTTVFTFSLQSHIADADVDSLLTINLQDACNDIKDATEKNYSASQFDQRVKSLAQNWHLGKNGCVIISDINGLIISDCDGHTGESLAENVININDKIPAEGECFVADIHGVRSYCKYMREGQYYIFASLPENEALFSRNISVYVTMFMEIIVFFALFVHIYLLINRVIVKNIQKVNSSLAQITGGNLDVEVNVRTSEEFASLSNDINTTVSALKHYIDEADARIDKELEIARQIQHSALPSVFPPFPNRNDFDIYAYMNTAKEVGGDFYDFYLLGEDKLALLIADVSGKGIPAAMFMMTAKTLIKSLVESGLEPAQVFAQANKKLCENNEAGMFVTAWLGILNLKTGALNYVNAGHNPPVLRRNGGVFEYLCTRANFILGGIDNVSFKTFELKLLPGDEIYLYTDGVTEATDSTNDLFGCDRLLESLNENKNLPVDSLCAKIQKEVDLFVGNAPQFDDITMLAVKLNCLKTENTIIVSANSESIDMVYGFIDEELKSNRVDKKTSGKIKIVADEIFSNIINYSEAITAKISLNNIENALTLTFCDDGLPFNPLNAEVPDTSLSIDERQVGGLGIFLVKKTADEINYTNENGFNILTVKFYLND